MSDEEELNPRRTRIMAIWHEYGNKFVVTGCPSRGRIRTRDPVHWNCRTKTYVQCTSDTYPKLTLVPSDFPGQRSQVVVDSATVPRRNTAMDIPEDPQEGKKWMMQVLQDYGWEFLIFEPEDQPNVFAAPEPEYRDLRSGNLDPST